MPTSLRRDMTGGRMQTDLEGPLNCLDTNKDGSLVAVAGRNVFKIVEVGDMGFTEKANLRVGKINLNLSVCDLAWNPMEDSKIASAATNGAIIIWNTNMSNRSKQELVISQHKRTVTRLSFHPSEAHCLLSGSQDWTIKLHDLRRAGNPTIFSTKETVRDIQFHPNFRDQYFTFAAALDNGNIQMWDIRNTRMHSKEFTAHNGPVFGLDWHPEEKNWLGTCGRDKMIKVWDFNNPGKTSLHSIQTIAAVSRIKWRPQRKYHIASCALLVDFCVNIWDVRRPYIPFAAFSEHKDVVTGIVWKRHEPHVFLCSSKDGHLYQHMFKDATRPADSANPVGVAVNARGDIMHSSADKLASGTDGVPFGFQEDKQMPSTPRITTLFRREPTRSDLFTTVNSILCEYKNNCAEESLSMDWFVESATRYQLSGRPVEDLCEHNAGVADSLQRPQIAQSWRVLKLLFASSPPSPTTKASPFSQKGETHAGKESDTDKGKLSEKPSEVKLVDTDGKERLGDTSTGVSEDESDLNELVTEQGVNLLRIASGGRTSSHSDLFFGDGDLGQQAYDYDPQILQDPQDWSLANEAFQLRSEIQDKEGPTETVATPNILEAPSAGREEEVDGKKVAPVRRDQMVKEEILSAIPFTMQIPMWNYHNLVVDMLKEYAKLGDVQMAVSVIIVLGTKVRSAIDDLSLEQWFMSYIDLLGKFSMWTVANEVIKLSSIQAVEALNQHSTTINSGCARCTRQIPRQRPGWLCDRCNSLIHTCAICHYPVKGLFVWCQGCSHGGHLQHLQDWLLTNQSCPAGCGHQCEYT